MAQQKRMEAQAKMACGICGKALNTVYAWVSCPRCENQPVCQQHCYCVCGQFNGVGCPEDADPVARWQKGEVQHPEVVIKVVPKGKK